MRREFGHIPPSFRADNVERRLGQIASRNRILLDVLGPYFEAYRNRHDLQWPYFSLTCDSHFSALGHEVCAEAIVEKLEQHRLLGAVAKDKGQ